MKVERNITKTHGETFGYRVDKYENGKWKKISGNVKMGYSMTMIAILPQKQKYIINWEDKLRKTCRGKI